MRDQSLEQKAVDLLDKIEALTTEYAPEVYDTAVSIVQVNAIGTLAIAAIGLLGVVCVSVLAPKVFKKISQWLGYSIPGFGSLFLTLSLRLHIK